jgi:hypothetical protein
LKELEFPQPASEKRLMRLILWWDAKKRPLQLVEFDLENAIASLNSSEPVIPV